MASLKTGIDVKDGTICITFSRPLLSSSSPGPSQKAVGPGDDMDDETIAVDVYESKLLQEGELTRQTIEIHAIFGKLVWYTRKSLSEKYEVDDLKAQIQQIAPNQVTKRFMDSTAHSEMLCYLDEHWTWFNTGLLKRIIAELGGDDDKKRLESYEHKLADYMKVRVCKLPKSIYAGEKYYQHGIRFIVKVDEEWGQFQVNNTAQTRKVIAGILELPEDELFLLTVDKGCVELTFQISHTVSLSLGGQLSNWQICALQRSKVVKLILDSKVIFDVKQYRSRYTAIITRRMNPEIESCGHISGCELKSLCALLANNASL